MIIGKNQLVVGLVFFILYSVLSILVSSYGSDETFYLNTANDFSNGLGYTGGYIAPAYSYFMYSFSVVFGSIGWRVLSVVSAFIAAMVVYFISRQFFSKKVSYISSLVFLSLPTIILLSGRALTEIFFVMLLSLSVLTFILGVEKNKKFFLLSAVLAFLTFFVKYSFVIFIPVFIGYLLIRRKFVDTLMSRQFIMSAIVFLLLLIPMTIYSQNEFGSPLGLMLSSAASYGVDEGGDFFYLLNFPYIPAILFPFFMLGIIYTFNTGNKNLFWMVSGTVFLVLYRVLFFGINEVRYLVDTSIFVSIVSGFMLVLVSSDLSKWFNKRNITSSSLSVYFVSILILINIIAGVYLSNEFVNYPRYVEMKEASDWYSLECDVIYTNSGRHVKFYSGIDPLSIPDFLDSGDELYSKDCIVYSPYEGRNAVVETILSGRSYDSMSFGEVRVYFAK